MKTALREAWEENGIRSSAVRILGCLEPYYSRTRSKWVVPVVATVRQRTPIVMQADEVDRIFTVPLRRLLKPNAIQADPPSAERPDWINYHFDVGDCHVFGLTSYFAKQVLDLYRKSKGLPVWIAGLVWASQNNKTM